MKMRRNASMPLMSKCEAIGGSHDGKTLALG
jgi:hypothetical protein